MLSRLVLRILRAIRYRSLRATWSVFVPWMLKAEGVAYGARLVCFGFPIVTRMPNSTIALGNRVTLCSDSRFTPLGVARPTILRTMRPNAEIRVGDDTGMSGAVICASTSVVIGRGCLLGADVQIVDTDFHPIDHLARAEIVDVGEAASAPVLIEDNVFVGAGSRILKGVTIGRDSVIGAGSIVSRSIPSGVIAAGCPAKVLQAVSPV